VASLRDRIQWILDNRKVTACGETMSMSSLSTCAGKNRSHMAIFLSDKSGKRKGFSAETIAGVAYAGQVSLMWLSTGSGSPGAGDIPPPPPKKEQPDRWVERDRRYDIMAAAEQIVIGMDKWLEPDVYRASGEAFAMLQEGGKPLTEQSCVDSIVDVLRRKHHHEKIGQVAPPAGRQPTEDELEAVKPKGFRPGKGRR
jgi:hypothetical protein